MRRRGILRILTLDGSPDIVPLGRVGSGRNLLRSSSRVEALETRDMQQKRWGQGRMVGGG